MTIHFTQVLFFNLWMLVDIFYLSVIVTVLIRLQIKERLRPAKFNSRLWRLRNRYF